jgi:hypothetical protein
MKSWFGIALLFLPVKQVGAAELIAIITRVSHLREAVRLEGPGVSGDPEPEPLQAIPQGVVIRVPEGAAVQVVCSTPSLVRVQGPASWRLDRKSCGRGEPLTQADYALVAPQGGRFRYVRGLWLFERELRGQEDLDPLAPVVLSPRNTMIRSPRPTLAWLRVPAAAEYRIEWSGRGAGAFSLALDAGEVACSAEVCELPWPADRPDLPPGRIFFLKVSARRDVVGNWHTAEEPVEVQTIETAQAALLEKRLADLDRLGFEGAAREAARAGVLARADLFAEAIESCRKAVELTPVAPLKVTLADLYLSTGLHGLAQALYRDALEDTDPVVRAAAAFGMGRIEYERGRYHEAGLRFRQALELYDRRAFPEESAAALSAMRKAKARLHESP